jgi:hypothetical protein
MLAGSFRLVTARLIPLRFRPKQPVLVLVCILAGCGGSSAPKEPAARVAGPGFAFQAPARWKVQRSAGRVAATSDSELVQVATFPLQKRYTPALFEKVSKELTLRMQQLASQTGGTVSGRSTVTAGGIRSHRYRVEIGNHVDEYTFVLRGKREYQLLCRRKSSHDDDVCSRLIRSFEPD